ncbi:IS110 family transposase [Ramlibacter aquaticus]|uniref:IS110 family transposase n=1 Tax=Ramlibacter aquaticus TaxID=2780094 RepID=A0ABR9SL22_9BURK|nr:IS110 family transposase [Ramlibacter aquaticus]MBE7942839.1 IS110 family transposase [Ramlibacter aquaticus]
MNATTVAVDLAKTVFQVAEADANGRITGTHRLTRTQFERFFANRVTGQVVMEACGSAHHWARTLQRQGVAVRLLPATHVKPYCLRNKTDAADCGALLQANNDPRIREVRVKSVEQQALQALHRARSQWMSSRTQRINTLRGYCREFGVPIPVGAKTGLQAVRSLVGDPGSPLPAMLRPTMQMLLVEVVQLEARIAQLERDLREVVRQSPACQLLLSIPGVGLLTATALVAAVGTNLTQFRNGRQLAAWMGLTPYEHSSGNTRRLGHITRAGDRYLRTLLTHGARSVLQAAARAHSAGRDCTGLKAWALAVRERTNQNKATCALANKLARICFATLRHQQPFDAQRACKPRPAAH